MASCVASPAPAPRAVPAPAPYQPPAPERPPLVVQPPSPNQPLLDFLSRVLDEEYAPALLKRRDLGWDPKPGLSRIREALERNPAPSKREKQRLVYELVRSSHDIHTGVNFEGAHAVWLGLHILRTADGKYRVAWRDTARTPGLTLAVGDVVESIDGVPLADAIGAVTRDTLYQSTKSFDQAFAEWFLVMRSDDVFGAIPVVGTSAKLTVRTARDKNVRTISVPWLDYDRSPPSERCPFWGKTKQGYLPDLGPTVWKAAEDAPFRSYVYAAHGATWGYVRFHSYALGGAERARALEAWKDAILAFKKHEVKSVVVDQLGNGGGNFLFAYALFSRLTNRAIRVPIQHYVKAADRRVVGFGDAAFLTKQLVGLRAVKSESDAETFLSGYPLFEKVDFMPKNLATVRSFEGFFAMLDELARSSTPGLTEPRASLQTEIAPHPDGALFSGPLVVLIDGLDISAAEYAAAALADGGRATLVGVTTAGAGGDQRMYSTDRVCAGPSANPFEPCLGREVASALKALGISSLSHTVTLGRRVDASGNPTTYIENRGVEPNREHRISARDLTSGFRDFRAAIREALSGA